MSKVNKPDKPQMAKFQNKIRASFKEFRLRTPTKEGEVFKVRRAIAILQLPLPNPIEVICSPIVNNIDDPKV